MAKEKSHYKRKGQKQRDNTKGQDKGKEPRHKARTKAKYQDRGLRQRKRAKTKGKDKVKIAKTKAKEP